MEGWSVGLKVEIFFESLSWEQVDSVVSRPILCSTHFPAGRKRGDQQIDLEKMTWRDSKVKHPDIREGENEIPDWRDIKESLILNSGTLTCTLTHIHTLLPPFPNTGSQAYLSKARNSELISAEPEQPQRKGLQIHNKSLVIKNHLAPFHCWS